MSRLSSSDRTWCGLAFVVDVLGEVCTQTLEGSKKMGRRQLLEVDEANIVPADGLEAAVRHERVQVDE